MPGTVTIEFPQRRVKDCYAPAPKIDLTFRCNGEEKGMVMNSLREWSVAGFDEPTTAPTVSTLGSAGTFEDDKYWNYLYVYVAKRAYPFVENAQTGGGSPAPRSNPSPESAANSVTNTNEKRLAIPTSQRADISHIWIYRTVYFDTAQEALDLAEAGNAFWIGEVANNPNALTVNFDDDGAATGLEQIETDNFPCPIFDKCVYADPFFWGIGNSVYDVPVIVTETGAIEIDDEVSFWFDGRDRQTITFDGITTGGYDGHGSFFFKETASQTAQTYGDIALTAPMNIDFTGTTIAHIRGAATTLYRSKPRNPFSWGFTDLVNEAQVPTLYNFSLGGSATTAIAVVPNLNLLKIDTEGPNRAYVLNLKNAGTPNFESSLRSIADNYCISNHHSQFSATLERGQNVLWGIDSKSFAIIECDGSSQQPISSKVFKTMRTLSVDPTDRYFFHGCYCPRLELNCLFIRTVGQSVSNLNKVVYQHGPTGQWATMDVFDVLCSAIVHDKFTGQLKMVVGTETGFVGEMFAESKYQNWFLPDDTDLIYLSKGYGLADGYTTGDEFINLTFDEPPLWYGVDDTPITGVIGNWMTLLARFDDDSHGIIYVARIASLSEGGMRVHFDIILEFDGINYTEVLTGLTEISDLSVLYYYIGLIDFAAGRGFNASLPANFKKIEELHSVWLARKQGNLGGLDIATMEFFAGYVPLSGGKHGKLMRKLGLRKGSSALPIYPTVPIPISQVATDETNVWGNTGTLLIDECKVFGIVFKHYNPFEVQLINYQLQISDLDSNGNNR